MESVSNVLSRSHDNSFYMGSLLLPHRFYYHNQGWDASLRFYTCFNLGLIVCDCCSLYFTSQSIYFCAGRTFCVFQLWCDSLCWVHVTEGFTYDMAHCSLNGPHGAGFTTVWTRAALETIERLFNV